MINQENVEKLYQLIIKDDERLCGSQWENLTRIEKEIPHPL